MLPKGETLRKGGGGIALAVLRNTGPLSGHQTPPSPEGSPAKKVYVYMPFSVLNSRMPYLRIPYLRLLGLTRVDLITTPESPNLTNWWVWPLFCHIFLAIPGERCT